MIGTLISVDEYLHNVYRPDCDYVDGDVLERNLGERTHSITQGEFVFYFRLRQREWNTFVYSEQRIQVNPTRFRIPDVCVCPGQRPAELIFRTPP